LLFTSEEEIAKWREDRRKRYPTCERVRQKLLEEEAKIQRGETAKDDIYKYSHYYAFKNPLHIVYCLDITRGIEQIMDTLLPNEVGVGMVDIKAELTDKTEEVR